MFWLFPITVAIAYATTHVILQQTKKHMKFLLTITFCFLLFLSGNFVYHTSNLFYMDYKVLHDDKDRVVELCDALDKEASIKMMAPRKLSYMRESMMRISNSSIITVIFRIFNRGRDEKSRAYQYRIRFLCLVNHQIFHDHRD